MTLKFTKFEEDENSKGFLSFGLRATDGREIFGSIENGRVIWNWNLSDNFYGSERLDALSAVQEIFGV